MSLYLTIFDGDDEVAGWVFGHYSDFGYFRDKIAEVTDARNYPTLMDHSDCDGAWEVSAVRSLRDELERLGEIFRALPPEEPVGAFEHTREYRRGAATLYDCFHNVDGENVFAALLALCDTSIRTSRPILFQ